MTAFLANRFGGRLQGKMTSAAQAILKSTQNSCSIVSNLPVNVGTSTGDERHDDFFFIRLDSGSVPVSEERRK